MDDLDEPDWRDVPYEVRELASVIGALEDIVERLQVVAKRYPALDPVMRQVNLDAAALRDALERLRTPG